MVLQILKRLPPKKIFPKQFLKLNSLLDFFSRQKTSFSSYLPNPIIALHVVFYFFFWDVFFGEDYGMCIQRAGTRCMRCDALEPRKGLCYKQSQCQPFVVTCLKTYRHRQGGASCLSREGMLELFPVGGSCRASSTTRPGH